MKKEADLLPTQPEDVYLARELYGDEIQLLEKGEIKMDCNQTRTVVEHDLRAISNYFGQACILEIGSLITRRISSSVIADNYGLLCPDGRVENLDSTKPCHWAARPWNSWVARTTHKQEGSGRSIKSNGVSGFDLTIWRCYPQTVGQWSAPSQHAISPSRAPTTCDAQVYGQLDASYFAVAVVKADSSITSSVNSKASPVILGLKNSREHWNPLRNTISNVPPLKEHWNLLYKHYLNAPLLKGTLEHHLQYSTDSATELVNVREDEFHKTLGSSYYRAPY
ncbi:hypothetical protein Hamer_G026844 [Homarus americanus]|uniref:Uncharacterized protein n=1 Tax=Homarus americanus TaxID=6706 RepID=A0A8J5JAK3_HOMAM|nr:hypothetical protein Hamer_G026844 [Homarus americanus]